MTIILFGKSHHTKVPYTVTFSVENNELKSIKINGKPNADVKELAKKFESMHPKNTEDTVKTIKLAMLKKMEFIKSITK